MATSIFARAARPCANAARARNGGAKPRLTRAKAPSLSNTRREIMSGTPQLFPLKLRRPERERDHLRRARRLFDRRARRLRRVATQHRRDQPTTVDSGLCTLDCRAIQL